MPSQQCRLHFPLVCWLGLINESGGVSYEIYQGGDLFYLYYLSVTRLGYFLLFSYENFEFEFDNLMLFCPPLPTSTSPSA